jgi:hypothetical protein
LHIRILTTENQIMATDSSSTNVFDRALRHILLPSQLPPQLDENLIEVERLLAKLMHDAAGRLQQHLQESSMDASQVVPDLYFVEELTRSLHECHEPVVPAKTLARAPRDATGGKPSAFYIKEQNAGLIIRPDTL